VFTMTTQHLRMISYILTGILFAFSSEMVVAQVAQMENLTFTHGFVHPFSGLNHILAMFAIGLLAAQQGKEMVWLLPTIFVTMVGIGSIAELHGLGLPAPELGISGSLLVFGLLVATEVDPPKLLTLILVGTFSIFHGYLHAIQLPASVDTALSVFGFSLSTITLHLIGITTGIALMAYNKSYYIRYMGGLIALFGAVLLFYPYSITLFG